MINAPGFSSGSTPLLNTVLYEGETCSSPPLDLTDSEPKTPEPIDRSANNSVSYDSSGNSITSSYFSSCPVSKMLHDRHSHSSGHEILGITEFQDQGLCGGEQEVSHYLVVSVVVLLRGWLDDVNL